MAHQVDHLLPAEINTAPLFVLSLNVSVGEHRRTGIFDEMYSVRG